MENAQGQILFVERALQSLRHCRVIGVDQYARRWFVPGFNRWYSPAIRRGFSGSMATVFDIGLLLVEPGVTLQGESDPYGRFLAALRASSLLECASSIIRDAPSETRPQVEWILVEALLRALGDVWGGAGPDVPRILPRLVVNGRQGHILAAGDDEFLKVIEAIPPTEALETFQPPQAIDERALLELPSLLRLFMAHMACQLPDAVARLDYEVVETCFRGANLRTEDHEPPPLQRIYVATRTRSTIPGPIAGVTRIETKKPEDPLNRTLPSEWMPYVRDEKVGKAIVFYGKPLIIQLETEKDKIPKHRTLVCFVVDAYAGAHHYDAPPYETHGTGHTYRHAYVYAKRQVCDLVRDVREALEVVRRSAVVDIDVAIFALHPYQEEAVVARKFALDQIRARHRDHAAHDRLLQLMDFGRVIPGFFDRAARPRVRLTRQYEPGRQGAVDIEPHVGRFLHREARDGAYRTIHLVPIGLENMLQFVTTANRYFSFESVTRLQMLLITLDVQMLDSDAQLRALDEPQWQSSEAQTLHEAVSLVTRGLPAMPLATLRRRFVASIIGEVKEPRAGSRRLVQLAN